MAERLVSSCAAYGSQLVVFSKAFVRGYAHGVMFNAMKENHFKNEYQKYYSSAINVPGELIFLKPLSVFYSFSPVNFSSV